jgi:tetratricopeptide (TPR) repeat protein
MIDVDPENTFALNLLSGARMNRRHFSDAEALALRAVEAGCERYACYWNAIEAQVAQQRFAAAESVLTRIASGPRLRNLRGFLLLAKRDYDAATSYYDSLYRHDPGYGGSIYWLAYIATVQGRLADAERCWREIDERDLADLEWDPWRVLYDLRYGADSARVADRLDAMRSRVGWDDLAPENREYGLTILILAELGRTAEADALLQEWRTIEPADPSLVSDVHLAEGAIAQAEGRFDDAAAAFLRWHAAPFVTGMAVYNRGLVEAAGALDQLGEVDSSIVLYERAIDLPFLGGVFYEIAWYPFVLHRLGELHETIGRLDEAVHYYNEFIDLWKDADPELQPQVEDVRQRIARLLAEPGQ